MAKGAASIFFQDQYGCRDTLDIVTQISSELFLRDTIVCNSFNLPVIKGVNITNEKYYDFPKNSLNSTEQTGAVTSSKSLYVYDKTIIIQKDLFVKFLPRPNYFDLFCSAFCRQKEPAFLTVLRY